MRVYTDNWESNDVCVENIVIVDDVVKLKRVDEKGNGESFWVIVTDVLNNGKFIGTVNNHLINDLNIMYPAEYKYNDSVLFSKQDIRQHKNKIIQNKQQIIVSQLFFLLKEKLGRMPTCQEINSFNTMYN